LASQIAAAALAIGATLRRPDRARPDTERLKEPGKLARSQLSWLLIAMRPAVLGPEGIVYCVERID